MGGNFSDAMRTAGTISRPDIRDVAYHRIALVRFKADHPGVAQTLARISNAARLTANSTALGERRDFAQTLVIAGFSRKAIGARARTKALEAETHNKRLDALLAMARAQALDGKPAEALLTIGRLRMELENNITGKILRQIEAQLRY